MGKRPPRNPRRSKGKGPVRGAEVVHPAPLRHRQVAKGLGADPTNPGFKREKFLEEAGIVQLLRQFSRIRDPIRRREAVEIMKLLADEADPPPAPVAPLRPGKKR